MVAMYLDYAESQASREITMRMAVWVERLDAFLRLNEYEVLTDAGRVSAEVAKRFAEEHYDVFRIRQDAAFESDFDREIKWIGSGMTEGMTRNEAPIRSEPMVYCWLLGREGRLTRGHRLVS